MFSEIKKVISVVAFAFVVSVLSLAIDAGALRAGTNASGDCQLSATQCKANTCTTAATDCTDTVNCYCSS